MFKIVNKRSLNPTVTLMDIEAPLVAKKAEAGQFIILRTDDDGERIPRILDLVEDIGGAHSRPPNTDLTANVSALSPSGVEVPCALM